MVFSSLLFTFYFLPIVLILNYLAKEQYRNYILLIASLLFYSYGESRFVFVMLLSIAVNYFLALGINKVRDRYRWSRFLLLLDVIFNLGILFVYKYLMFTINSINRVTGTTFEVRTIALPIGISFFTFQALSYVIDVYKQKVKVQKNPLFVALYISFFPQLIAGPIVRYSTIEEQIMHRKETAEGVAIGVKRFMIGFAKKIILANNLAVVVGYAFIDDVKSVNPLLLLIGAICYMLQIYYDFSGYSDMAIGLGGMFGFRFEENFNYPYIAKSVTEFWRRWHISLSQWFRDYVYIPLGGSRIGAFKQIRNMLVVWLLTGIWHGASNTFIVWGLGYFVLLVVEKYIVKPDTRKNFVFKTVWRIVTLLCVCALWVLFNSPSVKYALQYVLAMSGLYHTNFKLDGQIIYTLREYGVFIIAGVLFSTPLARTIESEIDHSRFSTVKQVAFPIVITIGFLWAVSYLILGAHNPFIYFNF